MTAKQLHRYAEWLVVKLVLPLMTRWPKRGKGAAATKPTLAKVYHVGDTKIIGLVWKEPKQSWAEGVYMLLFSDGDGIQHAIHFGQILDGSETTGFTRYP